MRYYETLYIIRPNLAEDGYGEVIEKFKSSIDKQKGVVVKVDEWGSQRLAYRIKKFDKGSYVLMEYCGEPGVTAELERDLKLDDRVLKYQTLKMADNVDPQELVPEEEVGSGKESIAEKETVSEEETAVKDEEEVQVEEVKNGV
jgi:small subunit ribosomal protein S6